jgi:hypothetical protein
MSTYNVVRILLMGLLLGILPLYSAAGVTVMEAARGESWQTQNLEALKVLFSEKAAVSAFIDELYKLQPDLLDVGFKTTVCEYELSDLNNDGKVELVAILNDGGRFCNTVLVVEKVNDAFKIFRIHGHGEIMDLRSRIVDLNHDRLKEILIPRFLAPYEGAKPIPIINDVYEWDGAGYSKANVYFKDYYRSLLPRLWSELEAVRQGRKLDVPEHKELLEKKYEREIEEVNKILSE